APDDPLTLIATDIAALDEDLPAAPAVSLSASSEGGDETASSGAGSGRPENEAEDLLAGTGGLESGPEELTEGGGGPEVDGEDLTGREGILSKITLPERSRESETRQGKGVDVVDSGEVAAVLEDLAALGATEEESARSAKPKGGEGPFVDLLAEEGPPRRERTLEINEDDFLEEDDAGGEEEDLQLSRPVPPPMPKAATGNGKGPDVTGDG
ncbi:MAG: hypothetical protein KAI47_07575, partial [Deltaproteobacteria bacterium]|nr:hypothetical protein [Deltaproteobacteria bacterium]